jgi:hypothetical protein
VSPLDEADNNVEETAKNLKAYEAARTAFTIHIETPQLLPHAFVMELSSYVKPHIWRAALESAVRKLRTR